MCWGGPGSTVGQPPSYTRERLLSSSSGTPQSVRVRPAGDGWR